MGSHAEPSCQESFKMRIILLLTVFTTLGLCQRQSPPRTPLTEPPQGQRCAGRNYNGNVRQQQYGWGPWSNWNACRRVHQQISGRCRKTRTRNCVGPQCGSLQHSEDLQEQYCRESDCDAEGFAEEERFFF